MSDQFKSGFVNLIGLPNSGKSTLINALTGEKMAIISPKPQTTRQRILGLINEADFQIIFSDTPGIIDPRYKLHEKMMSAVKSAKEDADVKLLVADITDNLNEVESNNEQSNINNLTSPESPQVALPSTNSLSDSDDLIDIKRQALKELSPLINHLDQSSEEKFKTTMMMIQASDDKSLIPRAFESAKSITSEKERAQALLDIVNEINYFTHKTED